MVVSTDVSLSLSLSAYLMFYGIGENILPARKGSNIRTGLGRGLDWAQEKLACRASTTITVVLRCNDGGAEGWPTPT